MDESRFEMVTDAGLGVARRKARLPEFVGMEGDAGAVLDRLNLGIIGLGSVGLGIALSAARLQLGGLVLVDPGRYKPASLLTHPILPEDAAGGKSKAQHAGELCGRISPRSRIQVHDGPLQSLDMAALAETDILAVATDNLAAEVEAAQRCLHLRKPLVHAAVHGDTLVAQVRFYHLAHSDSPCPACAYGKAELAQLNAETEFKCDGLGKAGSGAHVATRPTVSVSCLCSMAADLAMIQILRHSLGLGRPLGDFVLEYCGFTNRTVTSPLAGRNPACLCDHDEVRTPRAIADPLGGCSLSQLAERAGLDGDPAGAAGRSFVVGDLEFVVFGGCECGVHSVRRFARPGEALGRCERCGRPITAQPFFSHRPASGSVLKGVLDRPLRQIGAASARSALVGRGERGVLFYNRTSGEEAS